MRKLLLLIGTLAVVIIGCRAEFNLVIDVEEDGSGTASVEFGVDDEFRELLELGGGSPEDITTTFDVAGDEGVQEIRTEGNMTFFVTTVAFDDMSELDDSFLASDPDNPFQDFEFTLSEESAQLRARLAIPEGQFGDLGDAPIDPETITSEIFAFNFVFGMPGSVSEHNADSVLPDGNLVWEIPITGGEKDVFAVSNLGGGVPWWLLLIVGVIVVVAIVALVVALISSQQRSVKAIEDADGTGAETAAVATPVAEAEASAGGDSPSADPDPWNRDEDSAPQDPS